MLPWTFCPAPSDTPQAGALTFVFNLPGQDTFYTGAGGCPPCNRPWRACSLLVVCPRAPIEILTPLLQLPPLFRSGAGVRH